MDYQLVNILILSFFGSIAGLIGGVVFLVKKDWARVLCRYAIPFAAGILLSVSLLHLIPEAAHNMGENAYLVVLLAFIGSFLFEQYFAHLHHHEERKHTMIKTAAPLVIFGDTIHNFIDGVAIAAAYMANPSFGVVVTLATFLHETPHEIGDFGVLLSAGWTRARPFLANLASASAAFLGALMIFFVFPDGNKEVIGTFLAISAGVFLYLGASDFLPDVGEEDDVPAWKKFSLLLLGATVMYVLTLIIPDHH